MTPVISVCLRMHKLLRNRFKLPPHLKAIKLTRGEADRHYRWEDQFFESDVL